jgi:hypothetical protein
MTYKIDELIKQNGWHSMRFHALQDHASTDCKLSVLTLRSDGTLFDVPTRTFTDAELKQSGLALLRDLLVELEKNLESFRLCSCVVGTPCEAHKKEVK